MDTAIGPFIKTSWNDPVPTAPAIEFPHIPNPVEFYAQQELNKVRIKTLEDELERSKLENKTHTETIRRIKIAAIVSAALIVAIG